MRAKIEKKERDTEGKKERERESEREREKKETAQRVTGHVQLAMGRSP